MDLKKAKSICFLLLGVFMILMLILGITSNPVFGYAAIGVMGIYGVFHYFFGAVPSVEKIWALFG